MAAAPAITSVGHDTQAAVAFLSRFAAGEPIQVTAIAPDGPVGTRTFPAPDSDLFDFLDEFQGERNLYFTLNPVRSSANKKPKKKDIAAVRYFQVDIDPRDGFDRQAERERIKRLLLAFNPPPHILIDSGNGCQGIWRLVEELSNDGNYERLEEWNRRIADLLGGDNCHNIDRILRIPGTVNLPTETKRQRGYVPVVSTLIQYHDGTVSPTDLPHLPERFFQLLRTDKKLKRRWRGDNSDLTDKTKSALDMSIVALLKARGFTLDEIKEIHAHYAFGQGEKANVARMYENASAGITTEEPQYEATVRGIVWHKPTKDGPVPTLLSNFTAAIVTEIIEDDGVEQRQVFEIEAHLNGRSRNFQIPARQFPILNWPVEFLGANAIIEAGYTIKDRVRCAVQSFSTDVARRVTYRHTGWTKLDGKWVYLHAGGAIGAEGLRQDVDVDPPAPLAPLSFPVLPEKKRLRDVVRAELGILDLAPDWITVPLLAAPFATALRAPDFGIHLAGPTGTFKTELAALVQQHFGSGFDARRLPAAWSSTANALEGLAFFAQDAVLVIDDFAPAGTVNDQRRLHQTADRIFRAQGNISGRARMAADASLRATRYPRGMVLSTGEDIPRGQSLRARMLVLELSPTTVDRAALSAAQQSGSARSEVMAAFLKWLAPQLDERRVTHREKVAQFRDKMRAAHLRTPEIAAQLLVGFGTFLDFASDIGALDPAAVAQLRDRAAAALRDCARRQAIHITQADPARRFVELVASCISSGTAHIADVRGGPPRDYERWGWRECGTSEHSEPRPQGMCIGWVSGDDLFLDANAAYMVANRLAGDDQPGVTIQMLKKLLHDRGLLRKVEKERRQIRYDPRVNIAGVRRRVLHLSAGVVQPGAGDEDAM